MSTTDPTTDNASTDSTDSATTTGTPGDQGGIGEASDYEKPEWLSLDPDEEIVWVGEPVMVSLVGTAVVGLVLTVFLIGILILLALPWSYLAIKNTDFVVTTKSLYVKRGVVSTNIETVDIDKIQNTEFSQSFWGKQFDFADIDVSTAGSSGAEITFKSIADARAVRERISELGNRARRESGARADDESSSGRAGGDRIDELISELRATREAMERIEAKMDDGARVDAGVADGSGDSRRSDGADDATDEQW